MKSIYTFIDDSGIKTHVVISKIRRIGIAFGDVVIEYDNGDKESFDVKNGADVVKEVLDKIELFNS